VVNRRGGGPDQRSRAGGREEGEGEKKGGRMMARRDPRHHRSQRVGAADEAGVWRRPEEECGRDSWLWTQGDGGEEQDEELGENNLEDDPLPPFQF
jgi:hypothetical protein